MQTADAPAAHRAGALPIWAWLGAVLAVGLFWAVMMEAGALATAVGQSAPLLHELFHDGRHLLGVPCH